MNYYQKCKTTNVLQHLFPANSGQLSENSCFRDQATNNKTGSYWEHPYSGNFY